MKYQLLLADVDGTLTPNLGMPPREFTPSFRLIDAVNKAIAQQVYISLCTGRDKDTVIKICQKLKLNSPQIIEGGAKIINTTGKTLWVQYIDSSSVQVIFELLSKTKISFSIVVDGKEIVNTIPTSHLDKITAVLWYDLPKEKVEEMKKCLLSRDDIAFLVNKDRTGNTIYITDRFGTKAHGVLKLREILKVQKEQTIGIGDGYNDLSMLLECELKIAIGNAVKEVKNVADYIAPDTHNDGVAYIIEKFILS